MSNLRNIVCLMILFSTVLYISISAAVAAPNWQPSAEKYYKWDITPLNLTDSAVKYIVTTDIESVRQHWVKISGTWIKYTTVTGGLKYAEEVIIAQPPAPACDAFACNDDFGWTFNLSKNTALACPMVKITKGQAQIYDGVQIVDGEPKCAN